MLSIMKSYIILIYMLYVTVVRAESVVWVTTGKSEPVVLAGCNTQLDCDLHVEKYNVSLLKVNGFTENGLDKTDRYEIQKTATIQGQHITLNITNVTLQDAGIYRCKVDLTDHSKDINLTVIDFQWKSNMATMKVRVANNITMQWEYVSKAEFEYIFLFRKSMEDDNRRGLVKWEYGIEAERWKDDRMDLRLITNNSTKIIFNLRTLVEDDLKYKYHLQLKYSDTCIISHKPVSLQEDIEFQWLSTVDRMTSTVSKNVTLLWKYESIKLANQIIFYKFNTLTGQNREIALWTKGGAFRQSPRQATALQFNKLPIGNTSGEIIRLTFIKPIDGDFDVIYKSKIFCGVAFTSVKGIELRAQRPSIYSEVGEIEGRLGDDIRFVWYYEYKYGIDTIIITRNDKVNHEIMAIGHWHKDTFLPNKGVNGNRLMFIKTETKITNGVEGQITLVLHNTTLVDFRYNYICRITFIDAQTISDRIKIHQTPLIYSDVGEIRGQPQEDIQFVWYYEYGLPVDTIIFTRYNTNTKPGAVGSWNKGVFSPKPSDVIDRLRFNVTKLGGIKGKITLSLLKTTHEDYNFTYICKITFEDGKSSSSHGMPLYEKEPPVVEMSIRESHPRYLFALIGIVVVVVVIVAVTVVIYIRYRRRKAKHAKKGHRDINFNTAQSGKDYPYMKYSDYKVWRKNNNVLSQYVMDHFNDVKTGLLRTNLVTADSLKDLAKDNPFNDANKLVDLLTERGENAMSIIVETFKEFDGLQEIAVKLDKDLSKDERMKDEDYTLWTKNYPTLVLNVMDALPKLTNELSKREIIDDMDMKDFGIHRAVGKRTGAIKLLNILSQRGKNILPDINEALEACGIPKVVKSKSGTSQTTSMKHRHYMVWAKNEKEFMVAAREKIDILTTKLVEGNIINVDDESEITLGKKISGWNSVCILVKILVERGEDVLLDIINVLKSMTNHGFSDVTQKLETDLSRIGRMKDDHYRVWQDNGTFVVKDTQFILTNVIKKLLERQILENVDLQEIELHQSISRRAGAIKLVNILSERGEDVLPNIIEALRSGGFVTVAQKLESDLSRFERMNNWHYLVWQANNGYLREGLKPHLDTLKEKFRSSNILDVHDLKTIEKAEKDNKSGGSAKLVEMLGGRGKNVLSAIIMVLEQYMPEIAEKLKSDLSRFERLNYPHYKIWEDNRKSIIKSVEKNIFQLIDKLHAEKILVDKDKDDLQNGTCKERSTELVNRLRFRGKDSLPRIIKVMNACDLKEVANKLESDLSRFEQMDELHHVIWEYNKTFLIDNIKDKLPEITEELLLIKIIDKDDREIITKGNNDEGARELFDLLSYRGKDILLTIIDVLRRVDLGQVADKLIKDVNLEEEPKDTDNLLQQETTSV
ncbi:uncharacterized protein LOC126816976 isoform X2 [Patella vulgata]|uniref:uncharacterized protein LOC126816976 isoform X2 n=1 Tax=Patella vulgata TaxID=6465 RepID=UPI00217FF0D7|nr:uncharacterized protein LOC126816976 isoform X2 [Patella vulgata]